jgi:hypothetical chaperone protein
MFAGLDYGTSNSAIGVASQQSIQLIPLYQQHRTIPSTVYSYDRNLISDYVHRHLAADNKIAFMAMHANKVNRSRSIIRDLGIGSEEATCFFGIEAIENYIDDPEEGVFIKSPKSFLGSTGLSQQQLDFFEHLVTAMMLNMKQRAEYYLQTENSLHTENKHQSKQQPHAEIEQVVIGKPVNFQGLDSEKSNQQALDILTSAGKQCGFKSIEFLYEPLAAGFDFETSMQKNQIVLVIDIGGGTTDCSMVKMGPSHIEKLDRSDDFLAHSGQRIGGNDLDIQLAYQQFMPLFGMGTQLKKGLPVPHEPFRIAVTTNNVAEQAHFVSQAYLRELADIQLDAAHPELIQRLIDLQRNKQNHHLVRSAELAKIGLSDADQVAVDLDYVAPQLIQGVNSAQFEQSIVRPLAQIKKLIELAIADAQSKPDLVYMTGGSAKSPLISNMIKALLPNTPIKDGDYYGSVASGLTKWAQRIWR